jgi:hypothetical protein
MTESISGPAPQSPGADRYKVLVVILTVLATVITAIVAGLQADANIRSSTNNAASQVYALQAAGELHRQGLQTGYDINVLADYLQDAEEATILQLTALDQLQKGDTQGAASSQLKAAVGQARADKARQFSVFFTDPRYTPQADGGLPDMQAYLTDSFTNANNLVASQNTAADEYNRWSRKSDSYTSILTILAVALFLFGLAQALSPRLRILFAVFGIAAMAAAGGWMFLILVA